MTGRQQAGSPGQQTSSSLGSGPLPPPALTSITDREGPHHPSPSTTTTTSYTFRPSRALLGNVKVPSATASWNGWWSPPPFLTKTDHVKKPGQHLQDKSRISLLNLITLSNHPRSPPPVQLNIWFNLSISALPGVLDGQTLQILNYTVYKTFSWHLQKKIKEHFQHYVFWNLTDCFWYPNVKNISDVEWNI